MKNELAAKSPRVAEVSGIFSDVRNIIENTKPEPGFIDPSAALSTLSRLERQFSSDGRRVASCADLLFSKDIAGYGERCTALFAQWEKEGGGPALTAMITASIEHFGLSLDEPVVRAAFLSAILAEIPNDLRYHGNEHYRKVVFHAIRLAVTHNQIFAGSDKVLNANDIAILLTASCIHDLGHEGGDNLKDGVYTPGHMEQKAFDYARPYFEALGVERDIYGQIETVVFCTDITFFAGDNSPCIRMKKIYKHFFWNDDSEDISMMMMGKLRRYEDNMNLILIAMILHEADVGSSAGLSYEQTEKETISFLEERNAKTAGPKIVLSFLREQLGETMFTVAAKQLFGPAMVRILERAEKDIEQGRTSFYT